MLNYIPKYVRQNSDLRFGEKVTHEDYNEKLNLNTTQGDYNTEVLNALFNGIDPEETYHIPYIDNILADHLEKIETNESNIRELAGRFDGVETRMDTLDGSLEDIIDGTQVVGHAQDADRISGAETAGPSMYYGTDENSQVGFLPLPEFIYAEELSSCASVEGIYFVPMQNSVAESMLTAAVREKLNREAIVDYDYLENRPKVNNVTLTGNKSLADLGIQPVGDYATNSGVTSTLGNYYTKSQTDSAISTALNGNATQSWVNNRLNSYATTSSLNTVSGVANAAAVVRVGSSWGSGTPKNGDLLITL